MAMDKQDESVNRKTNFIHNGMLKYEDTIKVREEVKMIVNDKFFEMDKDSTHYVLFPLYTSTNQKCIRNWICRHSNNRLVEEIVGHSAVKEKQICGISRSSSTLPPSHYVLKIQSFSSLVKNIPEAYNSGEFEAGGYKWKLIIHPKGNIKTNVNDHISLYLMMVVDDTSLLPGSEVHAILRFFLFDQKNQNYLVTEGPMRCFDWIKHEWGVDRLVPLKDFENPTNGYLVDDTCVFGAEVYVKQATGKVDSLSMVKSPISYTHTWKIDNFYKQNANFIESTTFIVGDQKWKIHLYPKGYNNGAGTHISLYLYLTTTTSLPPSYRYRVYAESTLRIVDQNSATDSFAIQLGKCWYCGPAYGAGRSTFISLDDLNSPNKGYIKNKSCIVEADVTVYGVEKGTLIPLII